MSALQGLLSNVASDISACYNQGTPMPIVMEGYHKQMAHWEYLYQFEVSDYPSQWIQWQEELNYGTDYVFSANDYNT